MTKSYTILKKRIIVIGKQYDVYKTLTFSHINTFLFRLNDSVIYNITFKAIWNVWYKQSPL